MNIMTRQAVCIGVLLLLAFFTAASAEVVVIVHKDCVDNTITAKDIKNIYRNKKRLWSNGNEIVLHTFSAGAIHDSFMRNNIKNSPSQFKAFWRKQVFTGKGRMPRRFEDDMAMIQAVAKKVGSIGYIDRKHLEGAAGIKELIIK